METRQKLKEARKKGITIKYLALLSNIKANTLYQYNCGYRNLSIQKEQKIQKILEDILKEQ